MNTSDLPDFELYTKKELIAALTSKNAVYACAAAEKIAADSVKTNEWYEYFDEFYILLSSSNSLVRNRAINILAANAKWDSENRFEGILPEFLLHITDQKPITARQCIKALERVGQFKPQLVPAILSALNNADLSLYKESMLPLIKNDIKKTAAALK